MKNVLFFLFFSFACQNSIHGQVGIAVELAGRALSKILDTTSPDLVYDATTHSAVMELKSQYMEQISQTIKLVQESYEISRILKSSDSFLHGMSTIIQQNQELVNKAGWISESIDGLIIQTTMTEEVTKALKAQRRIMDAQLKTGDYEGALYSAEQYFYHFDRLISAAIRNFEWALKEGEDVNLTQADRLKFLEESDKNFEGAVKQRQYMEALASSMEANAASKTREDYNSQTRGSTQDKDPDIPVFVPKSDVQ